jgi:predicted metal-dependent enzyme (double-stranded beta helix superfamily)
VSERDFAHAYTRRFLVDTPALQVLVLSWAEGQWAEVHEHDVACGFTVLAGRALETRFERVAPRVARAVETRTLDVGAAMVTAPGYVHHLGAGAGERLVTLHVYTPALRSRPLGVVA